MYKKFFEIQKQPPEVIYKKSVLKNFAMFIGKRLYWRLATLLKRDSNAGVFFCEHC